MLVELVELEDKRRIVSGGTGATNVTATGTYTVNGLDIKITQYYEGNDGGNGSSAVSGGTGGTSSYIGGAGGDGARTLYTGTNETQVIYNTVQFFLLVILFLQAHGHLIV